MKLTGLTSDEIMDLVDLVVCLPLVLLMNFSLFQYLITAFYRRRREPLVSLLLFVAFLSFFSLIPFGFPDEELVRDLNDISEVCSVLTFLLQISILTRDINKKMKLRYIRYMMHIGECLVLLGLVVILSNLIDIIAPEFNLQKIEFLDELTEGLSLVFIVVFRFSFLSMAKGYKAVWRSQKTEIVYYLLFLSHEYPFYILNSVTDLSWEHVQGVWMRVTIVLCLWTTVKARLSSKNSHAARTTRGAFGPSTLGDPSAAEIRSPVETNISLKKRSQRHSQGSVVPFNAGISEGDTSQF